LQDFPPLECPSDVFSYTSFRGSFFEPRLHLSFETAYIPTISSWSHDFQWEPLPARSPIGDFDPQW
jgi:hypothetical protein